MGESEVEEIEGFGQGVMGLIRLWNGVEKLERARFAGPTPGGSPPTIAADEATIDEQGQFVNPGGII